MPPFSFKQEVQQEEALPVAANDSKYGIEYKDDNPVTSGEWKEYVHSGKISETRMLSLYYKKKQNAPMSNQEMQMFASSDKSKEIEDMLRKALENEVK